MTEITPSPLNNVISIDDKRIKNHLDRVVRGSVAEMTLTFVGSSLDQGHLEDGLIRELRRATATTQIAHFQVRNGPPTDL
jgi:hypothetical protein